MGVKSGSPSRVQPNIGRASSLRHRVRRRARLKPARPPGWQVGPPDFVGIGAQRSGTSWWYRMIIEHPRVVSPVGKEQHFFEPYVNRGFTGRDVRSYHSRFPRPPEHSIGEWTPRYIHDLWTPNLLRRAAPKAKVLLLLRDPWERYRSGLHHETRTLERVLKRGRGDYLRLMIDHDALQRSLYSVQLSNLLDSFDRSQVLILQFEHCVDDTVGQLRHTFEFLGLDPEPSRAIATTQTARPAPEAGAPRYLAERHRELLAADARRLAPMAPEIDLGLWSSCH